MVRRRKEMPIRDLMWPEKSYQGLDRGIRFAVRVLHAAGFETGQSCQGGKGHSYDRPTIEFRAGIDDADGFGALQALQEYDLRVSEVSIVWHIKNGMPFEKLWRITFVKTMEDRATDKPNFVYGYRAQE